ncbi:response regulator [Zobellella sp. DQSA1]|uniref:response regulator n=1 Tax=Zobellella sp. DQSA1 TaxID=3342386 RepID=UPI0035BFE728
MRVLLRLERPASGGVWLYGEVAEQGMGIAPEDCDRVFSPFEQADASISRRFGGTGLGLAITRSLAELMDGEVGVSSVPGSGSTFWFRIRGEPATGLVTPSVRAESLNPGQLSGLRVLLVDDTDVNLMVATELLQEAGLRVETATSGEAALELLQGRADGHYDAVLLDLMMPGLDGLATCRRIRAQERCGALPVIAVSANASPRDILECRKAGMNGHVAKPIDERQLWQVLLGCLVGDNPEPFAMPVAGTAPVLDPEPLSRLRQRLPRARFDRLLSMLVTDCHGWREAVPRMAEDGRWEELRRLAHDMTGTAGHVGMKRLVAHAAAVNRALHGGDEAQARQLAGQVAALVEEALALLEEEFGGPPPGTEGG